MTPAQEVICRADMALAYLRHAAWGLNKTPRAVRIIGDWERARAGAMGTVIPEKPGETS